MIEYLTACNIRVFPCDENKRPLNANGFKSASTDPTLTTTPKFGIDLPEYVVIFDLDTYKANLSTETIDKHYGTQLDWDKALIQRTPSGGAHYAFYTTQPIKQGSNIDGIEGFDIRVHGKGYICSGEGYTPGDAVGVLKLAAPTLLPHLQNALTQRLVKSDIPKPPPPTNITTGEVHKILKYLPANCGRTEWMQVAMGLKHYYANNDEEGFQVFDVWSKTAPEKYNAKEARYQWDNIKPVPDNKEPITIRTLGYMAIPNGYIPTGKIAAEVFGKETSDISNLVDKINAGAATPGGLDTLALLISTAICSDLQREALKAHLKRALRDAGLSIPARTIDQACKPPSSTKSGPEQPIAPLHHFDDIPVQQIPGMGGNHQKNADFLIELIFKDRLKKFGPDDLRWWCGSYWETVPDYWLRAKISNAFRGGEYSKTGVMDNTQKELTNNISTRQEVNPPKQVIYFKNGVMHTTGELFPHHHSNYNTGTLAVSYNRNPLPAPNWYAFVNSIFDDPQQIDLLQEIVGYTLISDNLGHQKAIALEGAPRSGKGTILEIIHRLHNGNTQDFALSQLTDPKILGAMRGKAVVMDRDAKEPSKLNAPQVQSYFNVITANEPVTIPIIYAKTPFTGRLNTKMIIACNGIPVIYDDSGASPNRWIILQFDKSFLGKEDLTLINRLHTELEAIGQWALVGLERLIKNGGFTMPESTQRALQMLEDTSSPIGQFIYEKMIIEPGTKVHLSDLYGAYKFWCKETGHNPQNRTFFRRSLIQSLRGKAEFKRNVRIDEKVKAGWDGAGLLTPDAPIPLVSV